MGETQNGPFQLSFNASLKVDFQGSRVTSDGGLILVRELDERLGFGVLIDQHLTDSRRGKNTQFPFADLLRQSVYSRLAGYEDLNDDRRLSQDPNRRPNRISCHEQTAEGNVSKESVERHAVSELRILRSGKSGPFRPRWRRRTLKTRLAIVVRGG